MMNLGTYVGKQYESRGIAIGEMQGERRGIIIGESRGILIGRNEGILSSAKKFLERGYSLEEIEDVLGITEEELMNYMKQEK